MLGDNEYGLSCLRQLNGNIKIVRGNHDTDSRWKLYQTLPNVECLGWAEVIKYRKYQFYLSHHPTMTSNLDKDKPLKTRIINLCGHSHITDKFIDFDKGLIYHIEVDSHNCYPRNIDDIIEDIKYFGQN